MFDFRYYHWKLATCSIISILLFFGCAEENAEENKDSSSTSSITYSSSITTYSIGGTVTGLSGFLVIKLIVQMILLLNKLERIMSVLLSRPESVPEVHIVFR